MAYRSLNEEGPRQLDAVGATSPKPSSGASDGWDEIRQAPGTRRQTYAAHDVIYFEGDDARHLYEIVSGAAMLYKLLPDGRRQVVEVLGPGDLFGFDMDDQHDCSAETLVGTTVLVFNRRDIEASSAAQSHLTRCALQQVCAMHDHAVLLGRKSAYERVASFLMRFVPDRGTARCAGPDDENNDSQPCDVGHEAQGRHPAGKARQGHHQPHLWPVSAHRHPRRLISRLAASISLPDFRA